MTAANCPQCQQPLPPDAPEGLCPTCVLKNLAVTQGQPLGSAASGAAGVDIGNAAVVAARLPQFEILELLGRGGMGVVYKARQIQLDRVVALKILPPVEAAQPDFAARFLREARALAKLSHPNIVSVYDFGECNGLYFFTMEYVDGANLRQLIQARQLGSAEALAIVPRICDALQFAHEEGVMHRDIKPENILLDKKGRVKIADFGLAKLLGRSEGPETMLTLSGMTLGTPRYMAPEQIEKPESVDHRADIYSLGVVFYEMLTGELPMGRFALPSERVQVDVRLDEIVLRSLEKDVLRRYQHASEVRNDVESVASGPAQAPPPAPVPSAVPVAATSESQRWSLAEILSAVTTLIAVLVCGANGVLELARKKSISPVATGAVIVAGVFTLMMLATHQFRKPAASRAGLPGMCLCLLAACTAALPWTQVFSEITGWNFWHGVILASLNFLIALLFFIIPRGWSPPLRGSLLLLTGAASFAAVMIWNLGPVKAIGDTFITAITRKPVFAGAYLAAILAFLTVIAGALQFRSASVPASAPPPPDDPEKSPGAGLRPSAIGLLIGGVATVLFAVAFSGLLMEKTIAERTALFYALVATFFVVYGTLGVFAIRGALNMLNQESYGASRTGALCSIFSLNFLSLPMGIWATVALTRPGVRGVFANQQSGTASAPSAAAALKGFRWERKWFGLPGGMQKMLQAMLALILLLSLLGFLSFEVKQSGPSATGGFKNSDVTVGMGDPWYRHSGHTMGFTSGYNILTGSALLGFAAIFSAAALMGIGSERKRLGALSDPATFEPKRKFAGSGFAAGVTFLAGLGLTVARLAPSEEPLFYTFSGDKGWINTPDGPAIGKTLAEMKGITSAQVKELNKIVQKYHAEFVALERRHTDVTRKPDGRVIIKITAFPEESLALARRFADEMRGILGRDVIPAPEPGKLMQIGLFRHAGEFFVHAELWQELKEFHYFENLVVAPNTPPGAGGGRERNGHSSDPKTAFPEEYQVYWTGTATPADAAPAVEAPRGAG